MALWHGSMSLVMSYRCLDAERRQAIVESIERLAAASMEPEEMAEVAAQEVKELTGASRAWIECPYGGDGWHPVAEELSDVAESISVPVERDGFQVALLTVVKDEDGFSPADIETLRFLGRCVSSLPIGDNGHAEAS